MNHKRVYFVTTGRTDEIAVLQKVKPPRILCSYWYFKSKPLEAFCETLGYVPEILLDSGAYSAYAAGKNINLLDYMNYIENNASYISQYISLDVIGDDALTRVFYEIMCFKGYDPIPVFHYNGEPDTFRYYLDRGVARIALGGTVPIADKSIIVQWCNALSEENPDVEFHLLGSTSSKLLECDSIVSCDATSWYMMAVNGYPTSIPGKTREAKRERAEANLFSTMERFNDFPIPNDHSSI